MYSGELERLYKSKNIDEIFKFFSSIKNTKEMLDFAERRPHSKAKIVEIRGDKRTIVVAPTKDSKGDFAKGLVTIFKGFHIILVESGYDPYFNYARNTNKGIKAALRYSPKWLIVSNDDMYKIDDTNKLKEKLLAMDEKKTDVVWVSPKPDYHHSRYVHLVKMRGPIEILRRMQGRTEFHDVLKRFKVEYTVLYGDLKPHYAPFLKKVKTFLDTEDFFIISGDFAKKFCKEEGSLYDEIFLNGAEDAWFSLKIAKRKSAYIDFKIGSYVGSTHKALGNKNGNDIRVLLSMIIFDYKLRKELESDPGFLHF